SDKSGQDDIKWYTAQSKGNGTYTLSVSTANHNFEVGKYNVHVYGQNSQTGKLEGLPATTVTLVAPAPKPTEATPSPIPAKIVTTAVAKGSTGFDVTITNVPAVMTSVRVPVWSDKSGQDDIKWYTAQSKGNGTYTLSVSTANHNFEVGKYNVHVYGQNSQTGKLEGLPATTVTLVSSGQNQPNPATIKTGKVTISNLDKTDYTFTTTISDVNMNYGGGISKIRVAVWSNDKGQDDIVWAEAVKQKNNTYSVLTRLANHSYGSGKYNVHVYYELKNGKMEGLGAYSTNITGVVPRATVQKEVNELLATYRSIFNGMPGKKSLFISPLDGTELAMIDSGPQRSASAIKLFILAAAHAKATRGELNLASNYTVKSSDIVEASLSLSGKVGKTFKLSDIASYMIQTSDNSATNIMIRQLGGIAAVNAEIRRMGYNETTLNRYMRIPSQINAGLENYISVHEAGDLIKNIVNGTLRDVNGEASMKQNLNKNVHNYWLTNQTRTIATVFDKPGNDKLYGVENDVAVITKNGRGYVVALLTQESGSDSLTFSNLFSRFGLAVANKIKA
ncbi:GBS Bsp-like repeat-containing protein, partial [Streptococcus hyovaginalis]